MAPSAISTWTQTDWTTPSTTLAVAASGTNQFFRPTSAGFGVLTGTFGVCAGSGPWCQGPSDSAPGQTLRLAGNWKSDAGNFYSSDLNADGISEVLFSNHWNGTTGVFNGGWIYWGQGTPTNPAWNATAGNRTDLPTQTAIGPAVADLNGDGLPEVIFSNYFDGNTYNVHSYIYWGQPGGAYGVTYTTTARTELPTMGGYGMAVADLNRDGRPELVFSNFYNGSSRSINSYIYWGQAGGAYGVTYSAGARTDLPTVGAMGTAIADLNNDGAPEVVFVNGHDGVSFNNNSYIYWGQVGGTYGVQYSASARSNLPTLGAHGVTVADLNQDGLAEIVFANNYDGSTYNVNSYIYWGQAGGTFGVIYTSTNRTNLPGVGAHKVSAADVNSDGHRDVVVQNYHGGFSRIFWGPHPTTGTASISWTLPITFGFRGLSLSDLNSDGRLDLLTAREGSDPINNYWAGGTSGRIYLHTGNNSVPYATSPSFDLPVQSATGAYASFGPGRGSSADWISQPRPVYGTAFATFGVLESMLMDSGQNGTVWQSVQANTQLSAGTGVTLFVAASDSTSALNNPAWMQVGAMINGTWTQTLSSVSGRYARYRVVLWRNRATEASPALQTITFTYITQAGAFSKTAPANGATGQPVNPTLSWGAASGV
ncbi:MAG: VCBS repeat-containing protein, partial [Anaerolineae bacterium]|nr:VCBS repeat-containing protein [Thermoflexales bacterium]MDW8406751.1 VCBS repeat-containing protein [Anaerolineae bacterium]